MTEWINIVKKYMKKEKINSNEVIVFIEDTDLALRFSFNDMTCTILRIRIYKYNQAKREKDKNCEWWDYIKEPSLFYITIYEDSCELRVYKINVNNFMKKTKEYYNFICKHIKVMEEMV